MGETSEEPNVTSLTTDPELLEQLKRVAGQPMSETEIREQKISFIMGAVQNDGSITRERVEEVIRHKEGRVAS